MSLMQKVSSSSVIGLLALLIAGASPLAAQFYSLNPSQIAFTIPAGGLPQSQAVSVTSSNPSNAAINVSPFVEYPGTGGWLTVSSNSATAPATLTMTANVTGLSTGSYLAFVDYAPGFNVAVNLTVGGSGTGTSGSLTTTTTSINLTSASPSQNVIVGSTTGNTFPITVSTSSTGGNWLSVSPNGNLSTGNTFVVIASSNGLATGTYSGTVLVQGNGSSLSIPVTFSVNGGGSGTGLTLGQSTLNFNYQIGGTTPAPQSVSVTTPNSVNYTAIVSNNAPWLLLNGNTSNTPTSFATGTSGSFLTVSINPAGLTNSSYSGTITVSAGTASQTINVFLNSNSSNGVLSSSPQQLAFSYFPGGNFPASQSVALFSNTNSNITIFSATPTSVNGWLQVTVPSSNVLSGQNALTVSVNPTGLGNTTYAGSIAVVTSLGSLTIQVSLGVGTNGGTGSSSIAVSTNAITFQGQIGGGNNPSPQLVSVSSLFGTQQNYSVTVGATTPSGWFTVSTAGGQTPSGFTVIPNIGVITAPGSYQGTITVTNTADGTSQTIAVTLNIGGGTLTVLPTSLNFAQTVGGAVPVAQTLQVNNTISGSSYTATSNASWLVVSPISGTTPATLSVSVNSSGLSANNYSGTITIQGGSAPVVVGVNFSYSATSTPSANPPNLTFNFQNGGTAAPAQTVTIGSTGSTIAFTASATSTGNWLSVSPTSGSTTATLTVNVNPTGLSPGNYPGTITVTGSQVNQLLTIPVTLNVTGNPAPVLTSLVNAASFQSGPVAPGEIVTVRGIGMGPAVGVPGVVSPAGALLTNLSAVRVLFDGIESPLLYVRQDQINAIAPYEIFGRVTTQIVVEYQGVRSTALQLNVADTAPGIFTVDSSGSGQGAVLNQNGTVNSPSNPAQIGSVVSIYATGEGQTNPPGQDGRIILTDLRKPLQNVSVKVGGVSVPVLYAGSAPSLVSGALQVNVRLTGVASGIAHSVELDIGNGVSPTGVNIAIQ